MDALGDYGSDSDHSGSSSSCEPLTSVVNRPPQESSSGECTFPDRKRPRSHPASASASASPDVTICTASRDASLLTSTPSSSSLMRLPPPDINKNTLIHWSRDYLTPLQQESIPVTCHLKLPWTTNQQPPFKGSCYAQELQQDHEFNNPSQFESAILEMGIQQSLGSTLVEEEFEAWEQVDSLCALELQARSEAAKRLDL